MKFRNGARVFVTAWLLALLIVPSDAPAPAPPVVTVLHFNDTYQLGPVDGGKAGGMDRLAHVIKQHRARFLNSLLLFPGDLISPSMESSMFKGGQLVAALNLIGIDAASPGNHEFD